MGSLFGRAAVRDEVPGREHPAVRPGQPRVAHHVGPRSADPRREGRPVADPRPGSVPRRRRRPHQVDRRRLHAVERVPLQQPRSASATRRATRSARARCPSSLLPRDQANYVRNSVKAVVDAYDGTVTLYAWDPDRPGAADVDEGLPRASSSRSRRCRSEVLDARALPAGPVQDPARDPQPLPRHRRVDVLQRHRRVDRARTTRPSAAGAGVPAAVLPDPADAGPGGAGVLADDDVRPAATPDAGRVHGRRLRAGGGLRARCGCCSCRATRRSPARSRCRTTSSPTRWCQSQLSLLRRGGSEVELGNLLSLPFNGGLLYVEPVYIRRHQRGLSAAAQGARRLRIERRDGEHPRRRAGQGVRHEPHVDDRPADQTPPTHRRSGRADVPTPDAHAVRDRRASRPPTCAIAITARSRRTTTASWPSPRATSRPTARRMDRLKAALDAAAAAEAASSTAACCRTPATPTRARRVRGHAA